MSVIIHALGLLVPAHERGAWRREWESEIVHDLDRRLAAGQSPSAAQLALVLRSLQALSDALWMRRRHGIVRKDLLALDIRHALRTAARRPWFNIALVTTLALGIGATTAIFSVVNAVILRPAPFPNADRLVEVLTFLRRSGATSPQVNPTIARAFREDRRLFERVEPYRRESVLFVGFEDARQLMAARVTPSLLALTGARPALGRLFADDDTLPSAPEVVVLSHGTWHSLFGGSRDAIGKTVRLNEHVATIVGVLPKSYTYPLREDVYLPWRGTPHSVAGGEERYSLLGLLAASVTTGAAQAEAQAIAERVTREMGEAAPTNRGIQLRFIDQSRLRPDTRNAVWVLAGAVLCVLIIACVNAANLLLAQGNARQREFAIRFALGADRATIIRHVLTESLMLSVVSGVLGVMIAYWGMRAMIAMMPLEIVFATHGVIGLDQRALLFSLALSALTGIAFGIGPAIRLSRRQSQASGDRSAVGARTDHYVRRWLVAAECAMSMLLLVGAGLLINSFIRLTSVDIGIDTRHLLVVEPVLPRAVNSATGGGHDPTALPRILERLQRLPGIRAATVMANSPPTVFYWPADAIEAEGSPPRAKAGEHIPSVVADTTFFETMGIGIAEGRSFDVSDLVKGGGASSAIIDVDLARWLWPSHSAVGKRFRVGPKNPWLTVVGVARDAKLTGPDDRTATFALYVPIARDDLGRFPSIILRTGPEAVRMIPAVRHAMRDLDAALPIRHVGALEPAFGATMTKPRFLLSLMSIFAAVALLLAAVGVYGVMAYVVSSRTREIGVRLALGARTRDILGGVLKEGLAIATVGIVAGLFASTLLTRFLRGALFEVRPTDTTTLLVVSTTLLTIAVAAVLVPARRASRISPLEALRGD